MMGNILAGKKGIIFGALDSQSIAWNVAERCVEEGAQIVLTNAPVAMRMGEINVLAEKCNAPVIAADATSLEDMENLFQKSMEHFGGKVNRLIRVQYGPFHLGDLKAGELREVPPEQVRRLLTFLSAKGVDLGPG